MSDDLIQIPKPPSGVCPRAKKLWSELWENFDFPEHKREVLVEACHALSRADEARRLLKKEGMIQTDRFEQKKPHPAVMIEHNARTQFARLINALGLPEEVEDDGF